MRVIKKLPDPFCLDDEHRVASIADWAVRRREILGLLMDTQYGTMPTAPDLVRESTGEWEALHDGRKRRLDQLEFTPNPEKPRVTFNLTVTLTYPSDEAIARRAKEDPGFREGGLPALIYVGSKAHNAVLENGYIVINYPNDTLEPMEMGKPVLGPARGAYATLSPKKFTWGSISAWAWGAIRVLDHAVRLEEINSDRIAISGHSRNGKTTLLAGAIDDRFAVVNPAGSGCAGAGSYLALGDNCEDLAALTSRDRWWAWTHPDFENFAGKEESLPFDQHFLMSLIAPRPLLRTEGIDDHWANPEGTSVSFLATQPIYDFLDVSDRNAICYRPGGHDHTEEDASALVALCDESFFGHSRQMDFSRPLKDTPAAETLFDWTSPT